MYFFQFIIEIIPNWHSLFLGSFDAIGLKLSSEGVQPDSKSARGLRFIFIQVAVCFKNMLFLNLAEGRNGIGFRRFIGIVHRSYFQTPRKVFDRNRSSLGQVYGGLDDGSKLSDVARVIVIHQ